MPYASYDTTTGVLLGQQRPIAAIYADLVLLTAGQKTALWTAFTTVQASGLAFWAQAEGPNAPALAALSVTAIDLTVGGTFTTAIQLIARLKMVAIYVQAYPTVLINPLFDLTINIPGYT